NGNDITNAKKAKRNQQAEGRFRAVRSRTQRVQAKDRDALHRTDLLGAFVTGLDGLTDHEVKYVHDQGVHRTVYASRNSVRENSFSSNPANEASKHPAPEGRTNLAQRIQRWEKSEE